MAEKEKEGCDDDLRYNSLAHQIEREDALVNTRLTWMLTTHGFLFASLAFITDEDKVRDEMYLILRYMLPFSGFALSILSHYGVKGANIALDDLKSEWSLEMKQKKYIKPFGSDDASKFGSSPSKFLPLLFAVIWLIIFSAQFFFPIRKAKDDSRPAASAPKSFNSTVR